MLKLVEIAKSWIIAANPTVEQQIVANYRISICDTCPHKKYHEPVKMYTCGLCGCPLSKKIFSPLPGEQACPDQRWEK